MRKSWTLEVDGIPHEVDVDWDVTMTGSGRITVDGALVHEWGVGTKWPGISKTFVIGERTGRVTQGWFSFDLTMDGVQVPPPRQLPGHTSRTAIAIVVGLALVVVALGIFIAIVVSW